MTERTQLASDTVTLLLCSAMSRGHTNDIRAHRIRRCAKLLQSRGNNKGFKAALRKFRKERNDHAVVRALEEAESSYWIVRGSNA